VRIHHWLSAPTAPAPLGLPAPLLRDLDMVQWLIAQPPDRVFALERPAAAGRTVQVHLGFPGGGMALVDYTSGLPDGNGYRSLSVIGAAGAAHADDHQNMQIVYRGGAPQAVRTAEGVRHFTALVQEFLDALHAGRDLSASTADWRGVLAVADAVQKSLASGQAVAPEAVP
jgi:predicted dehydrogenase